MLIKNNTILITEGSSGLGLEMAKRFLENHNTVIICGRSTDKLKEAKLKFPQLHIYQCDISAKKDLENFVNSIKKNHPKLNYLVNNAAIVHREPFMTDEKIMEKLDSEMATNFIAPVSLIKLLYPLLEAQPDARIVNITTGLVFVPKADYTFYNSTKAALHSFTKVLRHQLKNKPVQFVEVLFPAVDTPWHNGNPPKIAISAEKAVHKMLKGLEAGKEEILVEGVKKLYFLSRLVPGFAFKLLNNLKS